MASALHFVSGKRALTTGRPLLEDDINSVSSVARDCGQGLENTPGLDQMEVKTLH
jgi:hypothetical protein